MTDLGKFSNEILDRFSGHTARECLEWLCGERLGHGMSREVFRYALDESYVIKFELREHKFQNIEEITVWQTVEYTEHARWFAPVISISGCGRIMLQRYAEPLAAVALPADVPSWFTDLKPSNWGYIGKQPVCVDYGRTLLMTKGLSKRMRRADWT